MSVYEQPAATLEAGNTVVTAAGTPVQLTSTSTPCAWVKITAAPNNGGNITVGDEDNVDATSDAEAGVTLDAGVTETFYVQNANVLWLDTTNSGDEVGYLIGKI